MAGIVITPGQNRFEDCDNLNCDCNEPQCVRSKTVYLFRLQDGYSVGDFGGFPLIGTTFRTRTQGYNFTSELCVQTFDEFTNIPTANDCAFCGSEGDSFISTDYSDQLFIARSGGVLDVMYADMEASVPSLTPLPWQSTLFGSYNTAEYVSGYANCAVDYSGVDGSLEFPSFDPSPIPIAGDLGRAGPRPISFAQDGGVFGLILSQSYVLARGKYIFVTYVILKNFSSAGEITYEYESCHDAGTADGVTPILIPIPDIRDITPRPGGETVPQPVGRLTKFINYCECTRYREAHGIP